MRVLLVAMVLLAGCAAPASHPQSHDGHVVLVSVATSVESRGDGPIPPIPRPGQHCGDSDYSDGVLTIHVFGAMIEATPEPGWEGERPRAAVQHTESSPPEAGPNWGQGPKTHRVAEAAPREVTVPVGAGNVTLTLTANASVIANGTTVPAGSAHSFDLVRSASGWTIRSTVDVANEGIRPIVLRPAGLCV